MDGQRGDGRSKTNNMMKLDVYGGGAAGRGQLKSRGARTGFVVQPDSVADRM